MIGTADAAVYPPNVQVDATKVTRRGLARSSSARERRKLGSVSDDTRAKLQQLWDEHMARPFPSVEAADVAEHFGVEDFVVDLALHDSDVAGRVSSVLGSSRSGADELGSTRHEPQLASYLERCAANARDEQTRISVAACREYLDQLDRMLELARRVPKR